MKMSELKNLSAAEITKKIGETRMAMALHQVKPNGKSHEKGNLRVLLARLLTLAKQA
jgi:ribosomal protein L29